MKKISLVALAAVTFAATSALAAAGDLYMGLSAGYQMVPGKVKGITGGNAEKEVSGSPKGFNMVGSFGYMVSDEFRTALAFQYIFDQKKKLDDADVVGASGVDNLEMKSAKSWNVMAHFYYDFLNSSSFTPFVGAGVGYGSREYGINTGSKIDAAVITQEDLDKSKKTNKGFVFAGTLGAAYKMSDSVALEVAYMFQSLPKAETKQENVSGSNIKIKGKNLAHNIMAGVRFAF